MPVFLFTERAPEKLLHNLTENSGTEAGGVLDVAGAVERTEARATRRGTVGVAEHPRRRRNLAIFFIFICIKSIYLTPTIFGAFLI